MFRLAPVAFEADFPTAKRNCFISSQARSRKFEKRLWASSYLLNFCLSVCKTSCNDSVSNGRVSVKSYIWIFCENLMRKSVSLKPDKNTSYFTWRPLHIYDNTSLNSSKMQNGSSKICKNNQNIYFLLNNSSPEKQNNILQSLIATALRNMPSDENTRHILTLIWNLQQLLQLHIYIRYVTCCMHFCWWYHRNSLHFWQIRSEVHTAGHGPSEGHARGQRQGTDGPWEAAYQRSWP
jgi:hypothetical protein